MKNPCRIAVSALSLGLLAGAPLAYCAGSEPEDIRFKVEKLLGDLPQPMHLEFGPDGRIWINEYGGVLKIYDPKTLRATIAAYLEIFKAQENGFLAFALDPQFSKTGWIYILYSPVGFEGQYLSRFDIKDDKLVPDSEKVILKYEEQRLECCHHGASLKFGPDGNLYFSAGDNTNPFGDSLGYAPLDQRPGKEPWDGARNPGNSNNLVGKVNRIRVKPDGGYEIPEGNLFPPGTPKTRPEIYAMGCRNPWRLNIDEQTGYVYWGEVGPDARTDGPRGSRGYDEINQARKAGYFGWPFFVGDNFPYAAYDYETKTTGELFDPAHPRNTSRNNTGLVDLPPAVPAFIYWPYTASERWPELGEGGRTACAGPVFHWKPEFEKTNGFPQFFDRSLLFWDWQRPFIKWARLDADSNLSGIEPFTNGAIITANTEEQLKKHKAAVDSGAANIKRPVDAAFGTDGCLYILDYGETWGANPDAALYKISYLRGNLPPIAKAMASATSGQVPLKTILSAKGSRDPEGSALTYTWTLQPSGKVLGAGEELAATLEQPGNFSVELVVADAEGEKSSVSLPLVVGNTPPVVTIDQPENGDFFEPGKKIGYTLSVVDAEDGASKAKPLEFGMRTVVTSAFLPADGKGEAIEAGLSLMRKSDCFNCHAIDGPLVGPSLMAIADRYRKQPGIEEILNKKVRLGGNGAWGEVPMLAHPQHTEDEVAIMLNWMLGLEAGKGGPTLTKGLEGQITAPKERKPGSLIIEALYTDLGAAPAGELVGKKMIALRSPRLEAEETEINGPKIVGGKGASNKKAVGATNHGHNIRIPDCNVSKVQSVTVRTAVGSPVIGSKVEVHLDSPTGPLAATVEIPNTGGWENWAETKAPFNAAPGRHDLFLVMVNPGKSGLMNLDWVEFGF